jgi:hypothetical protein
MRRIPYFAFAFLCMCLLLSSSDLQAEKRPGQNQPGLSKVNSRGDYIMFDVNRISTPIRNNGSFNRNPLTGNAGFEWPKGTGNTANYASGLWLGGKRGGIIRVAVAEYAYEFDAGPIAAGVNPLDPQWRMYRIRRGDNRDNSADYRNWPWQDGAPVLKAADGSDSLDAGGNRIPQLIGDMTTWCVFNDNNQELHTNMNTLPLGIEVHLTAFGFNRSDALGDNIFFKWKFINKSGETIDSTYVTVWTDIDMGDSGDDLDGCDTTLGLGYTYNDGIDGVYQSQTPATGFDFLQGPLVPGAPTDTARFPDGRIFPGKKLLKMTSFIKYNNDASPLGNPNTGQEVFNYMKGVDRNGAVILDHTGQPTVFMYAGDPVAGTGWVEAPGSGGDRRFMMSAGPFTMAPNDTQEIVAANLIAVGASYLGSITALKNADATIQTAYDLNFELAAPPPPPRVEAALLDQEIVLSWGEDDTLSNEIEQNNTLDNLAQAGGAFDDTYDFEGYVVYQLANAFGDDPKIVATFDRTDNPDAQLYIDAGLSVPPSPGVFDPSIGLTVNRPVKFGSNAGVRRTIRINRDLYTNLPLSNAKDYYFGVTAYTYNSESVPRTLESALQTGLNFLTVRPTKSPGARYRSAYGDTVTQITHTAGSSEATIVPIVVNPRLLTGHTYTVAVDTTGGSKVGWILSDQTSGHELLRSTNLGPGQGGNEYSWPEFGGIQWGVYDVENRPNPDSSVFSMDSATTWLAASRWENVPPAVVDPTKTGNHGVITIGSDLPNFLGQMGPVFDESNLVPIEVRFGPGESQKGYRMRRTGGVGTSYVIQASNPFVTLPFTIWDMSNPASPRQLTLSWRDQSNDTLFNPTTTDDGVEIGFIYYRTYNPAGGQWLYQGQGTDTAAWSNAATVGANADIMYGMSFKLTNAATTAYNAPASKITVIPFKVLKAVDSYAIVAPAPPTQTSEQAAADIDLIRAVPNPYYGASAYERNQFNRVVRFTNLPQVATIRIFNLAGDLVRTIEKSDNDPSVTTADWDLTNRNNLPVASGMYIVYIDMPGVGTKELKVAVILSEERLDNF